MSNTVKPEITSIDFLIEQLKNSEPSSIGSIVKNIVIDKEGIDKYCSWKKDKYTRNCAFKNEEFELIVLCWEPGHVTAIHGHDGQKCWVYQAAGNVIEQRFVEDNEGELKPASKTKLCQGELCYMDDNMGFHRIINESEERAVSLHIYANPIERCEVLNEDTDNFEKRKLSFDKVW